VYDKALAQTIGFDGDHFVLTVDSEAIR